MSVEVALGDILNLSRRAVSVQDSAEYEQITVAIRGKGLRSRGRLAGSEIKTKRQFAAATGQLLVSRIDARNGGLGVVPPELNGALVSGDFPSFDIDTERCLPAYLDYFVKRPSFWEDCLSVSEGSTNRVRLQVDDFLELPIALPPIAEQQGIIATLDAAKQLASSCNAEALAAETALQALRERGFEASDLVSLGELLAGIEAGKSPKAKDRPPEPGERAVLKVSAIRPGEFRPREAKVLDASTQMPAKAAVTQGDLLMNRASGSPSLLGSVCIVERTDPDLFLCDKTLRLVPEEGVNTVCLMEALALRSVRDQIELEGEGTTGAKNIGQGDIRALEIPWPAESSDQSAIASRTAAVRQYIRGVQAEASAATRVLEDLKEELITRSGSTAIA